MCIWAVMVHRGVDCLIVYINNNEPEPFMTMSAEGVLGIIQDVSSNNPHEVAIEFQIIKKGMGHRTMIKDSENNVIALSL
jgi:hypothetical protein